MAALLGQVVSSLLGVAGGHHRRPFPSLSFWPLWIAALLLACLAIVFLALAGFFALSEAVGPPAAGALTAAGLLVLAALLVGLALLLRPAPQPPEPDLMAVLLEKLSEGVGQQIAAQQPGLTIAVALAGVAIGYSPALRRWLRTLLGDLTE